MTRSVRNPGEMVMQRRDMAPFLKAVRQLHQRVTWLELPWYRKLWRTLTGRHR